MPLNQNIQCFAHQGLVLLEAYPLLDFHQAFKAFLFDLGRHRVTERLGSGAGFKGELEGSDAIEARLLEKVEQLLEVIVGLPRKANDARRSNRDAGNCVAESCNAIADRSLPLRSSHSREHWSGGCPAA